MVLWTLRKNLDRAVLGPVLEVSAMFSCLESRNTEISNLTITELFYSHILNVKRGSLHSRSFRRIYLSVLRSRLIKHGCTDLKSFGFFGKRAPGSNSAWGHWG